MLCTNNIYCSCLSEMDQPESVISLLSWKSTMTSLGKLMRSERLMAPSVKHKSVHTEKKNVFLFASFHCHKWAIWPKKNTQALKLSFAYQLTGQLQQDQLAWPFDLEWRNLGTERHHEKTKIPPSQSDQSFRWPNVFSCTKATAIGRDRSIWKR